jgi:hypothetical protein
MGAVNCNYDLGSYKRRHILSHIKVKYTIILLAYSFGKIDLELFI